MLCLSLVRLSERRLNLMMGWWSDRCYPTARRPAGSSVFFPSPSGLSEACLPRPGCREEGKRTPSPGEIHFRGSDMHPLSYQGGGDFSLLPSLHLHGVMCAQS